MLPLHYKKEPYADIISSTVDRAWSHFLSPSVSLEIIRNGDSLPLHICYHRFY